MSKRIIRVDNNVITLTDVIKLNALAKNEDIIVEIKNTKGQNSEVFKRFDSNITISIMGGLDYVHKDKYNDDEYRQRTFYRPRELSAIIKTFESLERKIDPSWSQLEKAMFVYKALVENLTYNNQNATDEYDRTLRVLKTRRGVCAGFALLYKEMMDRLGIPCEYQNQKHHHGWNVLKLDDKYVAVDLTWDINAKKAAKDGKCHFKYFANDQDFYSNKHHNIFDEKDEKAFPITTIPEEVLRESYQRIVKKNSHQSPIQVESLFNNKVEYAMEQINDKNICLYKINNRLFVNYYQEGMSKENTFNVNLPSSNESDITLPKYKIYYRDNNTSFCILKDEDKDNSYIYCELNEQDNSYKSYRIYSESNLIKPNTTIEEKTIANKLLKQERLIRKVENFNGYVGFVEDKTMFYDREFEKEQLNIINRK